jgi:hypothetical protein
MAAACLCLRRQQELEHLQIALSRRVRQGVKPGMSQLVTAPGAEVAGSTQQGGSSRRQSAID